MNFDDRGYDEFESALLRSASLDVPDAKANIRAWAQFAALLAGLATAHGEARNVSVPPVTAGRVGRFPGAFVAAKWLVIGAMAGSAVTLALVGRRPAVSASTSIASASTTGSPSAVGAPLTQAPASTSAVPGAQPGASAVSASSARRFSGWALERPGRLADAHVSSVSGSASVLRMEASTLAAEVAALDAARSALDIGMPEEALTLLRRYLRDFPKGKLDPEAVVMGIEALAAKGEWPQVTSEAARFLERYPNAPQRTRVEHFRAEAAQK